MTFTTFKTKFTDCRVLAYLLGAVCGVSEAIDVLLNLYDFADLVVQGLATASAPCR